MLPQKLQQQFLNCSYASNFVDGFSLQSLSLCILPPSVTLLCEAIENHISVIEALIGGMAVGVAYGFFSGQPSTILGPNGPTLVFETIIYNFCQQ